MGQPEYASDNRQNPSLARYARGADLDTPIIVDVADHVATISLNRPAKLNAFTHEMGDALVDALDAIDEDDDIRAVIVTGKGRGFCAGADLSAGASRFDYSNDADAANHRDGGGKVTLRMFQMRKPVIGAINGPAVGIGVTMTLAMDIRLASEDARFGFVFTRRGLVPEAASTWFLPRIVGISTAMEWVSTGRVFGAGEAKDRGLVRDVYAAGELLEAANDLAREIAQNTSGVAVALSRQMLWRMLGAPHPMVAHEIDSRGMFAMGQSADAREGVSSFLEKRPPRFPGLVSEMPEIFEGLPEPQFGHLRSGSRGG